MTIIVLIVILCIIFDYINGFHDAANAIATVVSTKVLTPFQAVLWAAVFNFIAFFIFKEHGVANTVAKSVEFSRITLSQDHKLLMIVSGVTAAIIWNLITWWYGIPSSSSHTLIGGFAGAAITAAGFEYIKKDTILEIVLFIFLAPLIGLVFAIIITFITIQRNFLKKFFILGGISVVFLMVFWFKGKPFDKGMINEKAFAFIGFIIAIVSFLTAYAIIYFKNLGNLNTKNIYKKLQLLSSALMSIAHGGNDAQKVIGVIYISLVVNGNLTENDRIPDWVAIVCYSAIAIGTLSGGWKIIKTMGNKITNLTPLEGVCAETASAFTLFTSAILKIPVSTTHTTTGSIIGVGAAKRLSAVRWGVTLNLIVAWIITIPISATISGLLYLVLNNLFIK